MPYKITKLPDEPIIVIAVDPTDFSPESAQAFQTELNALLDAQPTKVFLINLIPENFAFDMDDLLQATQLIRAQSELYKHPNIRGMVAVTSSEGLKLATRGLRDEVFGGIQVEAFSTLDEALAWIRSQK